MRTKPASSPSRKILDQLIIQRSAKGIHIPIATKLILSYLPIIIVTSGIFTVVGINVISKRILSEAQEKVRNDLNSAEVIYDNELTKIFDLIRLTSQRSFLINSISNLDFASAYPELKKIKDFEGLDFLTICDLNGSTIFRTSNPEASSDEYPIDEVVAEVLRNKTSVVHTILETSQELENESKELAELAVIKIIDTPYSIPIEKDYLTSGLVIKAASPIFDETGNLIGVIYGGILLNKNYKIVDHIKQTVFQGVQYKSKDIGTATIFLDDVRISTNVINSDGERAIGTRVSEEVYKKVVVEGEPWIGRAYVVNNWYITAYQPIVDNKNKVIGILYVGILEQKYSDLERQTILIFGSIALISVIVFTIISYYLSKRLSTPINKLVTAAREITGGNLNPDISITSHDEVGELSSAFKIMSKTLAEREENLKAYTKSKMESERLAIIGQLSANVAHELNNPLVGIITYSNTLLEEEFCQDSENAEYLKKIVIQANRCKDIVRGLLDFSRQDTSEKSLVDINSQIKLCLSLLENQAMFLNVKIKLDLNDIPLCLVDPSKIERVFMNLIINAAEAMEEGGQLEISTQYNKKMNTIGITFSDNGPGISEENLAKIFDPFFTTKDVGHGVGLGLSISYAVIKEHQGTIDVKSKIGEGTTFYINLPASSSGDTNVNEEGD